jgi:hypothetical protein
MRVDRGKGFTGEASRSGKDTSVQKKGGKVKLTVGDQDQVRVSQAQNSLKIQVNDSQAMSLNPEESKNLEIVGEGKHNVVIDSSVTIPIRGLQRKSDEQTNLSDSKVDPAFASAHKNETDLTARIMRDSLISEIPNSETPSKPLKKEGQKQRQSHAQIQIPKQRSTIQSNVNPQEKIASNVKNSEFEIGTLPKPNIPLLQNEPPAVIASGVPIVPRKKEIIQSDQSAEIKSDLAFNHEKKGVIESDQSAVTAELSIIKEDGEMIQTIKSDPAGKDLEPAVTGIPKPLAGEIAETIKPQIGEPAPKIAEPQLEDLKILDAMTPPQKSDLVNKIVDHPPVTNNEEMIQSVLLSARTPQEFNLILRDPKLEKDLKALMREGEGPELWDRLVGAYNRTDLALNPAETEITTGLLLKDPEELQKLLPAKEQSLLVQTDLMNSPVDLGSLDRRSSVCTILENAVRESKGLPLMNPGELREKVFDLLQNPDLPESERNARSQDLRTELGLSEFQMREIVTLPMIAGFESAIQDLTALKTEKMQSFANQIKEATADFGPQSVAVEISRAEQSEFVEKIDPEIDLFQRLKSAASELFSGPESPPVQADRLIHSFISELIPPAPRLLSMIENFAKSSVVFEHGKLQEVAQKLPALNIPELKPFVDLAVPFLKELPTLIQIAPQVPVPEFRTFEFLDRLQTGTFSRQLADFAGSFQEFQKLPTIDRTTKSLTEWKTECRHSIVSNDRRAFPEKAESFLASLVSGIAETNFVEMREVIRHRKLEERVAAAADSIQMGGDLIASFRNGHFVQLLGAVNQRMAGSPAVLQIIQQALHLTTTGTNFFHALFSREWERPLAQSIKKNPASRELAEIQGVFSDALNLFLPLTSIDNLTPFIQYQKQLAILRDENLMNDLIHQYQSKIAALS